jgi:hypothetical protein
MNGTVVNWALGAAMATVAVIAGRQLLSRFTADSAVHLVMAAGMVSMAVPGGGLVPGPVLRLGFGALAALLATVRFRHAVMFVIMALMAGIDHGGMAMAGMTLTGGGPSPLLLAAFGYTCVFALVLGWRLPAAEDPSGHSCEIVMLVSTAVMLLPML